MAHQDMMLGAATPATSVGPTVLLKEEMLKRWKEHAAQSQLVHEIIYFVVRSRAAAEESRG